MIYVSIIVLKKVREIKIIKIYENWVINKIGFHILHKIGFSHSFLYLSQARNICALASTYISCKYNQNFYKVFSLYHVVYTHFTYSGHSPFCCFTIPRICNHHRGDNYVPSYILTHPLLLYMFTFTYRNDKELIGSDLWFFNKSSLFY